MAEALQDRRLRPSHGPSLVLDATTGQKAKGFSEAAGCTGIVLAKLDGTAKGALSFPSNSQRECREIHLCESRGLEGVMLEWQALRSWMRPRP